VRRVLVANRGEIAFRAIRVCRQLGLESVAVYSSADANSCHRWAADHAICIGPPPPKSSYLNAGALIETAAALKCDAIYPGYGFLAENHAFAERSKQAGLTFIGPDSDSIARMGDKVAARQAAAAAGIPVVPGSEHGYTAAVPAKAASAEIGFPLLLKASGGGGGRGMRVVERAEISSPSSSRPPPKRWRRSAMPKSISSDSSPKSATSKSRCSATATAITSTSASAIAACSAATRSWSRKRPLLRLTTPPAVKWRKRRSPWSAR